jgi:hypothetical protein
MNRTAWKHFLIALVLAAGVGLAIGWLTGKLWADVLPQGVGAGLASGVSILVANLYWRRTRRD